MGIPPLPQPPENLMDWLILAGLIIGAIEGMRRRLINPMLRKLDAHADQHEEARQTREMLTHELAPNGHEGELPWDERNIPLRHLTIRNRVGVLNLEREVGNHRGYSERVLGQLNADRIARGLEPIEPEHRPGTGED